MTDDRSEMEAARLAGLAKRHEQRLENATYTAAEVKVLTEAALRLGRKEALEEAAAKADEIADGYQTCAVAHRDLGDSQTQHGQRHTRTAHAYRDKADGAWAVTHAIRELVDATSGRTDPDATSAMLKSLEGK